MYAAYIPLQPHSMFHFGEIKADVNVALNHTSFYAPSDILFSSLINCYQDLTGDASVFVKYFTDGHLAISSLFYYLKKEENVVHLLPCPIFLDLFSRRDGNHKMRNSIKLVSDGVWKQGFDPDNWLDENKYRFIQNNDILLTKSEFDILGLTGEEFVFKTVDLPKNPIHDVLMRPGAKEKSIFYQANVETGSINGIEIGLYFIYTLSGENDTNCASCLKTAVNLMAFSGIGGERNNTGRTLGEPGFAHFVIENDPTNEDMIKAFTNISFLNPAGESELKNVSYNLTILRGGRETGNIAYKVVRMIREGALLKSPVKGRLVDIGTDLEGNTAYRNGICLCLPIKYVDNNE